MPIAPGQIPQDCQDHTRDPMRERIAALERQLEEIKKPESLAWWIEIAAAAKDQVVESERQLAEARKDLDWMRRYRDEKAAAARAVTQEMDRAHEREDAAKTQAARLREALEKIIEPIMMLESGPAWKIATEALAGDGGQEKTTGIGSVGPVGGLGDGRPRFGDGGQEKSDA